MHESRMIAEFVPPGCCAIEKVRGSRMATPFAPPRPGSTPMMIPRMTPTNISNRLNGDSATPNPCISALISSTQPPLGADGSVHRHRALVESQCSLERPFGKRHREPYFEYQEKRDADAYRDRHDLDPGVLAQVPHEVGDIDSGCDVETQRRDHRDVHDRWHEDRQYFLQLLARHERFGGKRRIAQGAHQDRRARETDQQPHVEGKIAGLRPVVAPLGADTKAVEYDQGAEEEYDCGDAELHRLDRCGRTLLPFLHRTSLRARLSRRSSARARRSPLRAAGLHLARKPASFMSMMCRASSRATQSSYSFPLTVVWLNAPVSRKLFQSGVSRTFFSRST